MTEPPGARADARRTIGAEELHALLKSEFEAARAFVCTTECEMPLPFIRTSVDQGQPNWTVIVPTACPRHCHRVIEAIIERNGGRYELSP